MIVRWRRQRGPGWRASAAIDGVGALVTGVVLLVVAVTKTHEGAWIILLLIPLHVIFFRATRRHNDQVQAQLSLAGWTPQDPKRNVPARWWHHLVHNQSALLIKGALLFKPNTVVTSVPFHLRH